LTEPSKIVSWEVGRSWSEFESTQKLPMASRINWIVQRMNAAGLTKERRQNFKNWYIGLNFVDDDGNSDNINRSQNKDSDEHPAHYEVILVPPTSLKNIHQE